MWVPNVERSQWRQLFSFILHILFFFFKLIQTILQDKFFAIIFLGTKIIVNILLFELPNWLISQINGVRLYDGHLSRIPQVAVGSTNIHTTHPILCYRNVPESIFSMLVRCILSRCHTWWLSFWKFSSFLFNFFSNSVKPSFSFFQIYKRRSTDPFCFPILNDHSIKYIDEPL